MCSEAILAGFRERGENGAAVPVADASLGVREQHDVLGSEGRGMARANSGGIADFRGVARRRRGIGIGVRTILNDGREAEHESMQAQPAWRRNGAGHQFAAREGLIEIGRRCAIEGAADGKLFRASPIRRLREARAIGGTILRIWARTRVQTAQGIARHRQQRRRGLRARVDARDACAPCSCRMGRRSGFDLHRDALNGGRLIKQTNARSDEEHQARQGDEAGARRKRGCAHASIGVA